MHFVTSMYQTAGRTAGRSVVQLACSSLLQVGENAFF